MQIRHLTLILAVAGLLTTVAVEGQKTYTGRTMPIIEGGVGPVVSGSIQYSQIPLAARRFIDKHFKGLTVMTCEKEYASGDFEIKMSDGAEIDFDSKGEWREIDAPDGMVFAEDFIHHLLPGRAFHELKHRKCADRVESLERERGGFKAELDGVTPDTYHFSGDGRLLLVDD